MGDLGSVPGLGRSPGEGKGYPLQYSGLENPMDCIVHGVTESDTTCTFKPLLRCVSTRLLPLDESFTVRWEGGERHLTPTAP